MRVFLALLLVCLLIFVFVGFYFKWFAFSTQSEDGGETHVDFTINKDKMKSDVEGVKNKLKGKTKDGKTVSGTIQLIEVERQSLTVATTTNAQVPVRIVADTKIRIDGKDGQLTDLRKGDKAEVSYLPKDKDNIAQSVTVNRK